MMPPSAARAVLVLACLVAVSCDTLPVVGRREPPKVTRLPIEDVQGEVMAFADSYTAIIDQAVDRVTLALPDRRAELHQQKLRNVQNAIIIASGANPVGALLDMTVMVSLQRQVVEEYWIRDRLGEAGQPLLDAMQLLEQEIWLVAERTLFEEQLRALRELIPVIRARFSGQVFVSSIRASDFAADRRTTVANLRGGGSLLSLFQLDPLAGLSPAAQELAQSRLLAERAFFWAKRLPTIMNWQLHDFVMDGLGEPETRRLLDAAAEISESSLRLSAVAEDLPAVIADERAAALAQLAELAAAEREAALRGAFEGIAAEREAVLQTFEREEARLRGLLEELRATIDAGTALSSSVTATIESGQRMRESFARSPGESAAGGSERRPFDIMDYAATADATRATVEELNRVVVSLTELLEAPAWSDRRSDIAAATGRAQTGLEELIDRGYRRGLALIALLVGGGFVAAVGYRLLVLRFGAPRGGPVT